MTSVIGLDYLDGFISLLDYLGSVVIMSVSMSMTMDDRMKMFTNYLNKTNMEHKDYQYDGVKWCLQNELNTMPLHYHASSGTGVRGGFIADEMGLGKTILMIGLMYANFQSHTLIVLPPILIEQWAKQIYKTTGHKPLIYYGTYIKNVTMTQLRKAPIVITSYGILTFHKRKSGEKRNGMDAIDGIDGSLLHKIKWDRVICDEAHHLKNRKTARTISIRLLQTNIIWLVSGTPVQNNKREFYTLCDIIGIPSEFYKDRNQLKTLVNTYVLKRTKSQVGIELTNVQIEKHDVCWNNYYEMALAQELHTGLSFMKPGSSDTGSGTKGLFRGDIQQYLYDKKGHLAMYLFAKQTLTYPKLVSKHIVDRMDGMTNYQLASYNTAIHSNSRLEKVVSIISQRIGNGCGKLVFCHFREEIDEIVRQLRNKDIERVAVFDGRITSKQKRSELLKEKYDVLLLQINTGCEGLNLQENYSEVYFVTPHWNPYVEEQAIARCHRIGQTQNVVVHTFAMLPFVEASDDGCHTDHDEETICEDGGCDSDSESNSESDCDSNMYVSNIDEYIYQTQEKKRCIVREII